MIKDPIVLIGVGEMGGVFARGFLRNGHPVYPVTRDMDLAAVTKQIPEPALVLASVGEADLAPVLQRLPDTWKDRVTLLQNELLPGDWASAPMATVVSVWFEKKKGTDFKVIIPSPVYGPKAGMIADALGTLGIPVQQLENEDDLLFELVLKNLYILTTNIAGLRTGGTVGELWDKHNALAQQVGNEVIDIQEGLTGHQFDRERLFASLVEAFNGDPEHKCTGRSAPQRLSRALEHSTRLGLESPTLQGIMREQSAASNAGC